VRHRLLQSLAATGLLETIAVSLDTVELVLGNQIRELTDRAFEGLQAALRGASHSATAVSAYVVLTKMNLNVVGQLFDFLEAIGIDYVNVQPVYLPIGHSERARLGLTSEDQSAVSDVMNDLASRSFDCTSGPVRLMALETLGQPPSHVSYCFAAAGDYAYISPQGLLLGCPSKPSGTEIGRRIQNGGHLGRLLRARLERDDRHECPWQSGDCLGMYEMASRDAIHSRSQ
jgi:hypothetical protein